MIYIDTPYPTGFKNWGWSSHLYADSINEFHAFATRLGLSSRWFQNKKIPHYDLNLTKIDQALRLGAILISRKEAIKKFSK